MIASSQKGLMTEIQCELNFTKYGIILSKPITNDCRYDYIADINGKYKKPYLLILFSKDY